ncbi:hypothetical protein LNTAR_09711 [Lentisphaera araneosa HTCC2155]|uniref:Uncharacterized protein n=1 Tax=Lentisphaera araneosa HTCC2155 TaxID=313628 RepID=A6DSF5_9BACT|nr:hypothetical protein LNTAR_09711 [Lentisphaera araneosa HTCC2155]
MGRIMAVGNRDKLYHPLKMPEKTHGETMQY